MVGVVRRPRPRRHDGRFGARRRLPCRTHTEHGDAASTVRAARAAIVAVPATRAPPIRRRMMASAVSCRGLGRQAAGRGRGQAQGLTADDCAAILATAALPGAPGAEWESDQAAADRGAVDRAIVAVLFQVG